MLKKVFSLLAIFVVCISNFAHAVQWQFMFNVDSQKQGEQIAIYVDKDSIVRRGDITELTIRFDASTYPKSSIDCKNKKLFIQYSSSPLSIDSADNPIYTIACTSKWGSFFSK